MGEEMFSCTDTGPFLSLKAATLRLPHGGTLGPVQWEIGCRQQWALVGGNGSGKSTLAKALCGQVPVVGGEIVYYFQSAGTPPQEQIAWVTFDAQRSALRGESPFYQSRWNSGGLEDDPLTVADWLSERGVNRLNPFEVREAAFDGDFAARQGEIVDLLGIRPLLGRNLMQTSNGERRKVMLAQALLKQPRLLILDNPFAGLDRDFCIRLQEVLLHLMDQGMHTLLVTNDRESLPPGITHALLLEAGKVVAQGPLDALWARLPAAEQGVAGLPVEREPVPNLPIPPHAEDERERILVQMEGVQVSYGGARILQEIDWTVERGQCWALLGPNGAGKTTLLSLILADNPQAYANAITLFGQRRGSGESIWEIKDRIGWVAPELHLFYPKGVSCFDVVCSGFFDSIGRYQRCSPQQEATAREWMERLGLAAMADSAFDAVSEGEQRMVLLARALVKEPVLLVLDEPCQGLDADNRARVRQAVEAIGGRLETSMIYVTHRLDDLPDIITHVLMLEEGRVVRKTKVNGQVRWGGSSSLFDDEEE